MKAYLIPICLLLAGCLDNKTRMLMPEDSVDEVILYYKNPGSNRIDHKISAVTKQGAQCIAKFYNIKNEDVILSSDGTAYRDPFTYTWTRNTPSRSLIEDDRAWFNRNCADPVKPASQAFVGQSVPLVTISPVTISPGGMSYISMGDPYLGQAAEWSLPFEAMSSAEGIVAFKKWVETLEAGEVKAAYSNAIRSVESQRDSEKRADEGRQAAMKKLPKAACSKTNDPAEPYKCQTQDTK